MYKILITGSGGLIGSEAVEYYAKQNYRVVGIDNNARRDFFGEGGSTDWRIKQLRDIYKNYEHHHVDIITYKHFQPLFKDVRMIIHTAAQPSHDWAASDPKKDFNTNATGTLNLLEAYKNYCPEAVFIYTSTNKVYGDTPNRLPLIEMDTRWELPETHKYYNGIDTSMSVDECLHSLFGVSKLAADMLVQEYGRYFNLNTAVFRGGCLTGPNHSGVELHGFLSYLVKCAINKKPYTLYGYKGKQVRDNIHSHDLVSAFDEVFKAPRIGEVYNIGGGRFSNCSVLEAFDIIKQITNITPQYNLVDKNRIGDHIWWISDLTKFKTHYPNWKQQYNVTDIIKQIVDKEHLT